ncbi:MAG: hypothetical protein AB1505_29745 [Candidatus Latescibacterota bacterium]
MHTERRGTSSFVTALLGGPVVLWAERTLASGLPGGLDELRCRLARATNRRGACRFQDGEMVWEHVGETDALCVRAAGGAGCMRLQVQSRHGAMAGFLYFVAFFVGMFAAAALGGFVLGVRSLSAGVVLGAGGLLASYLTARITWRSYTQRRRRALASLLDALGGLP